MLSPYKTMSEVNQYLKDYAWHFTADNPYKIKDYKPKKKIQKYTPKHNFQDWNSDKGMVVK
jgi:Tfp pilus tip-associated adhesin PilY1